MKIQFPTVITLPWRSDAAEYWFTAISHFPWSMLLHSGKTKHPYSRFDILVADPIGTIITRGNITEVTLHETFTSLEDPFFLLNEAIKTCNFHTESNPDLPFQGGGLGFFGYDLVRRFEQLPNFSLRDIDIPDMAVGLYDWALIIDNCKMQVSLLSYSNIDIRLNWLKMQKKVESTDFHLTTTWSSNITFKEYETKFDRIQSYLQNGDCYQVNFAQRFHSCYEGDEWQAFTRIKAKNHMPFSAFLRIKEGVILSFSPERFIKLFNGEIQTRPIKGTLPRLISHKADLQQIHKLANSQKDRSENLMIVDLMRNDIGRVAIPGTVRVPEMFVIESFDSVYHLVSTITAHLLPCYNACDLLRAAFPGGSIIGAPKIRVMEIIDELEPHRRNAWCGSIGYLSACGCMDTSISIRTLIAFNGKIYCSAGGGIVADSKVRTEYQETFDKVKRILKQLENSNANITN